MLKRLAIGLFALLNVVGMIAAQTLPASGVVWERTRAQVPIRAGALEATVEFVWENCAGVPIRVIAAIPECDCSGIESDEAVVAPSGKGRVTVRVDVARIPPESQSVVILVFTDEPGHSDEPHRLEIDFGE